MTDYPEAFPEDIEEELAEEPEPERLFVNVYIEDLAYGGPEEGGIWYEVGELIRSTRCETAEKAQALLADERAFCEAENAERRSNIYHTDSEGRYYAALQEGPGESYGMTRPHYE